MKNKTARLTVLMDPARKRAFIDLCQAQDFTPSEVLRNLIRDFLQAGLRPRKAPAKARSTATKAKPAR